MGAYGFKKVNFTPLPREKHTFLMKVCFYLTFWGVPWIQMCFWTWNLHPSHTKSTLFLRKCVFTSRFSCFWESFCMFFEPILKVLGFILALLFSKRYKKKRNIFCCRLVSSAFWEPFFQILQQWTREFGCFVEYFDSLLTALTLSTASLQPSLLTAFLWPSPVIFLAPLLSATVVESTTHVTASYQATLSLLCL